VVKNRMNDAPNGHPIDTDASATADNSFNAQINAWCSQCHTRYMDGSSGAGQDTPGSWGVSSGDAIFTYRHSNSSNKPCTTCHVAHGSNAQMGGDYSSVFPYPDGTTSGSSRLLKLDNRGTCQACHDPTGSVEPGTWSPSAVPTPVVP
jgi:cytochrome c2